jgi:glycosyltransferase involved in cell wall biosynthesis
MTSEERLSCALLVVQPALPHYRRPFFEKLGQRVTSLTVLHGCDSLPGEGRAELGRLEDVQTLSVRQQKIGPVIWMPAMWRAAGDPHFDVAVFSWNSRYPQLPAAMVRARRAGIGVVLWGHGYSITESRARRTYRNFLTRYADAMITYNRRVARELMDAGISRHRVFVAPNALASDAIDAATRAWEAAPERLRRFQNDLRLEGDPVALHVSRLSNAANLRVLIETWRAVVAMVPRARLVIVGDGPAREALTSDIAHAGLGGSVRCVGPVFGEDAIAPYFLSAHLVLHPSKIGLSLNHAMEYGVPVVTFDDAGRHCPEFEALQHGANGLVATHGDIQGLAVNAARILLDGDLASRLGCEARRTMRARYSIEDMVTGFVDAVRRAHVNRGGRGASEAGTS